MNNGDYIKWSSEDEEGKFSHVGKIISLTDMWVEFVTNDGILSVKRTDGTFEPHAAIKLAVKVEMRRQVGKAAKTAKAGTKLAQAIEIFKGLTTPTRGELIAAFVSQLGMTSAGASTYAAAVRKHK